MTAPPLLSVARLVKHFPVGHGAAGRRSLLHAVDDVSFAIAAGETVGLVGESGCGKSTLVKLITRLLDPTSGEIVFEGDDIGAAPARDFARSPARARIQKVFQDPTDSLNPRFTAFELIADPLRRLRGLAGAELRDGVSAAAAAVALPAALLTRYPHQLSGGQKARVGIARAVALEPSLLVLDEPTAALDVSVQAVILHLLAELKAKLGMSYLFVSHDLNVVRLLCDRVLVMYLGRIVESGPADQVFRAPRHPYTQALVAAAPVGLAGERGAAAAPPARLAGEPRSPIDPDPTSCRFVGRCAVEVERCRVVMPELLPLDDVHRAACHRAEVAVALPA